MEAIWKDRELGFSGSTPYVIEADGIGVFTGRCDMQPNGVCEVLSNKLCQYYLHQDYPEGSGVIRNTNACKAFTFKDFSGNTLGTEQFIYDWSYEDKAFGHNVLSMPVNGHMDPRMRLMWSTFNDASSAMDFLTDADVHIGAVSPITIEREGGITYIPYTANTEISVSTNAQWLSAQTAFGKIILSTEASDIYSDRSATLTVSYRGIDGTSVLRYTVIQKGFVQGNNEIWYYATAGDQWAKDQLMIGGVGPASHLKNGLWAASASTDITAVTNITQILTGYGNAEIGTLTFPSTIRSIGGAGQIGITINEIVIKDSADILGSPLYFNGNTFRNTALTKLTVGSGHTVIAEASAFYGSSFKIDFGSNGVFAKQEAFRNHSGEITIDGGITTSGDSVFKNSGLKGDVILGAANGDAIFSGCTGITKLTVVQEHDYDPEGYNNNATLGSRGVFNGLPLTEIYFTNTIEYFENVYSTWLYRNNITVVHCKDGDYYWQ